MTAPTVSAQAERLAGVLKGMPGLTTALPRRPDSIQSPDLPLLWLWAQDASYSESAFGSKSLETLRTWEARVYVRLATTGVDAEGEIATEALIDALAHAISSHPVLATEGGQVFDVLLDQGSDEGITALPFGEKWYVGTVVRFRTRVVRFNDSY